MPFVEKIVAEYFVSDKNYTTKEFYDLESGLRAIKDLDGGERSNVFFEGKGEYLFINGGKQGKYMAKTANFNQRKFYNLVDPEKNNGEQTEVATSGGTTGKYPLRVVTDLNTAIKIASYFYETGKRDPASTWEAATSEDDL